MLSYGPICARCCCCSREVKSAAPQMASININDHSGNASCWPRPPVDPNEVEVSINTQIHTIFVSAVVVLEAATTSIMKSYYNWGIPSPWTNAGEDEVHRYNQTMTLTMNFEVKPFQQESIFIMECLFISPGGRWQPTASNTPQEILLATTHHLMKPYWELSLDKMAFQMPTRHTDTS